MLDESTTTPIGAGERNHVSVESTAVDGLLIVRWETHVDDRGFFRQTHQVGELEEALHREVRFLQGNHSRSRPGVLRGFHAEPWDKLVYVVRGEALAVIADIRPESRTFGRTETFHLGDPPGERVRLFVSEGLANAFFASGEDGCDYIYDVTAYWHPDVVRTAIAWDDPDLDVGWPTHEPVLSEEDQNSPTLRELFPRHPRFA
jgi:dTDP-4-dehydrorhamnose 3,5-epimerase